MAGNTNTKLKIQAGVTTIIGLVAIYLVIVEPEDSDKLKWSYGIIGLILGYWLK